MSSSVRVLVVTACLLGSTLDVRAQGTTPTAAPSSNIAAARVSKDAASAAAVKQVPGGKLQTISLGSVGGKLAYTAFVTVPGKPGRTTVVVDATSGAVVSKRP